MDVQSRNQNINFSAKYITTKNILVGNRPKNVSIIELTNSKADKQVVKYIKKNWKKSKFSNILYDKFDDNNKVYLITRQKSHFNNINPRKVLGFADVGFKRQNANLRFLQVIPKAINTGLGRVKKVGQSLIEGLVLHFKKAGIKTMDLFADHKVKPFYKKVFPEIKDKESTMDSYTNLILSIK